METPYKNLTLAELAELAFQYATGDLLLTEQEADELVDKLEERLTVVHELERFRRSKRKRAA